jgi:hypothetical protein
MLIYQLDCWVFQDDLMYWCEQGYDYIGAPWFDKFSEADDNSKMLPLAGNGGLSLRRIQAFIEALENKGKYGRHKVESLSDICIAYFKCKKLNWKTLIWPYQILKEYFDRYNIIINVFQKRNEDAVISELFPRLNKDFRVAPADKAMYFAFEVLPRRLMAITKKLPFGCHAFERYDWDFWRGYIRIE